MDYDVLILGGGIIGCAVAYELSKYNLNIAVIEKDFDIADDISFFNTSIVYDGCECKDNLISALEEMGNSMLANITKKLNVSFKRLPNLTIATDEKSLKIVEERYQRAIDRALTGIKLIDGDQARKMNPRLGNDVIKALYSENTAVIRPYDLAIAYGEIAYDNGVAFRLEEIVTDIQSLSNGFWVTTNKNKFKCKFVVNTIPSEKYLIDDIKEKDNSGLNLKTYYVVLNNLKNIDRNSIISKIEDTDNSIIFMPSSCSELIIGVNSGIELSKKEVIDKIKSVIPDLKRKDVKDIFYDNNHKDIMIIDDSEVNKGYIRVTGKYYGEVTISPAIATIISETIVEDLKCGENKSFIDKRREFYRFRDLSMEERNELIRLDKRYGKMICICNQISEGEIVDSIRRPLGARTVEGIKRRTAATFGNCNGAYCISSVIDILARELDKKPTEIVEDSKNSNVLTCRIKEFDEI
ncbi:MAG: FAD-dependent oxidoreductase [Clostridium perfringens]|nr:FAD-dependent oxidoreductase [Clostridium perfringens]